MTEVIRTPDQRLRVFVSSTLGELAEERSSARDAVDALRMHPVMFELGARPHPPRELYRAYLEQSHIFVGIYWQSYGWVAPEEDVSGIEDEYRLSEGKPRLIYVREPAPDREPGLQELLEKIKADDSASYKRFGSPSELRDLIRIEFPLEPLRVPTGKDGNGQLDSASVRLFMARARAARPDIAFDDAELSAIAEISRRLDGLPLALELAAARVRLLPPSRMIERLDDAFSLLTTRSRDLPERHRTMRSTIAWSYELLPESHRKLFDCLSVFEGGWSLDAAEEVSELDIEFLDAIQTLLENSLIRETDRGPNGEPRFSMLESMRQFGHERLIATGADDDVRARHAAYYIELAEQSREMLRSKKQKEWQDRLVRDNGNVRTAMNWHLEHRLADRLASAGYALWPFWWNRDHLAEGRRWMQAARAHEMEPLSYAHVLAVEGALAFWQGDYSEALMLCTEAERSQRELGDELGAALSRIVVAAIAAGLGDADSALTRLSESVDVLTRLGEPWELVLALNAFCWVLNSSDSEAVSEEVFEEALARSWSLGTAIEMGMALGNLGHRRAYRGDSEFAHKALRESLRLHAAEKMKWGISYTLDWMGELVTDEGDSVRGARLYGAADGIRESIGSPLAAIMFDRRDLRVARLRSELGADFQREWEAGRTMKFKEVIEYALDDKDVRDVTG